MAYQRFNKEKYLGAYKLKIQGKTLKQIGNKLRLSPQRVGHMCRVIELKISRGWKCW